MTTEKLLSKIPEITIFFWIIKILSTTVGETFADFLNIHLGIGLTLTSVIMGVLLIASLILQLKSKKYIPSIYWLSVALVSVVGTLITDNLTDNFNVSLQFSALIFSLALALVFGYWYKKEKTISIHSVNTKSREVYYWLVVLFTFALGTALGDLIAESLGLGYLATFILFSICIAVIYFSEEWFIYSKVFSFWAIYILTRPLGASVGDFLSQSHENGGLAFGTTLTSEIFLFWIFVLVMYLTVKKADVIES